MSQDKQTPDSTECALPESQREYDTGEIDKLKKEVAGLKETCAALEKQTKELNYIVYKLLYEMGGREIIEKAKQRTQ